MATVFPPTTRERTQTSTSTTAAAPVALPTAPRVLAIDALRGFAMLLLISEGLLRAIAGTMPEEGWGQVVRTQIQHSTWHGFTLLDFGFPGFVLLMGASIALALERHRLAATDRARAWRRIAGRSAALFVLGIFASGGLAAPWPAVQVAGVLQRLSLCYFACGTLTLFVGARGRVAWGVGILLLYWAAVAWVPVPGVGAGDYSSAGNLVGYVDHLLLPGIRGERGWHPEGILGTFTAIATCFFGSAIGAFLVSDRSTPQERALLLCVVGLLAISTSWLWDFYLPINKRMWTSSFALMATGWGALALGMVYQLTDIWAWRRWTGVLALIGRHSLFAYVALPLVRLDVIAQRIVGGDVAEFTGEAQPIVLAATQLCCAVGILWWLDRRDSQPVFSSRRAYADA